MPRKSAVADQTNPETGSDLLNEFSAAANTAATNKAAAKEKAPKTARAAREKVAKPAKPAKTLDEVIGQQENNPQPWIITNMLKKAQARVKVAGPEDGLSLEQALSDIASVYAQLAFDASSLSAAAGAADEKAETSVGRLMEERFSHMLGRLGVMFGQPKKAQPYTRDADGNVISASSAAAQPQTDQSNDPSDRPDDEPEDEDLADEPEDEDEDEDEELEGDDEEDAD